MKSSGAVATADKSKIKRLRYRAEIDGLRALAVAVVILFHARVPGFSGGYVGVDVFFVISGYLITQLLQTSTDYGPRTLAEFYLRRARRILPALYVVLFFSAAMATILFFAADLERFGRDLALAGAFLGNFGAMADGGYFDPGERVTPLRHLWSIGVEEQFYVFFPLLLFALIRLRMPLRRLIVLALMVASLLLSFWAASRWPIQNYYMLLTRAWELLIGVFLAMSPRFSGGTPRANQILSALGLIALGAVVWHARIIEFPGISTIAACAATAVLISTNTKSLTAIGRALSWRPLVFTGLISYSLYLWHAPILAFAAYYRIKESGWIDVLLILPLIYLVAFLSWAAIETPFRSKTLVQSRTLVLWAALPSTMLLGAFGYLLVKSGGLPQRLLVQPLSVRADADEHYAYEGNCSAMSLERIAAGELCSYGPQDGATKKVVVWGDSHAAVLLPAYRSLAAAHGVRIYFGIKGACWPLLGAEAASSGEYWRARCAKFNAAMAEGITRLKPDRVILNAYWLDPGAADQPVERAPHGRATVLEGIKRTIETARSAGATVCVVLTVPGYPYPIPYAVAMAQRRHISAETLSMSRAEALDQYRAVDGAMHLLAKQGRLRVVDPKDVLCPTARCLIAADNGEPLYRDTTHLSVAGSRLLSQLLESCIADLGR